MKWWVKNKPLIEFASSFGKIYPKVFSSAKSNIPEWYKKAPSYLGDQTPDNISTGSSNISFKKCMPVLDAFITGYQVVLPFDIVVGKNIHGSPNLAWRQGGNLVQERSLDITKNIPVPHGCYENQFVWSVFSNFKIPLGYSMLITHPLNRFDLPFITMSGVVDGGFTFYQDGAVPFYIKKDFNGLIPQGTPILQIIPFKSETWNSKLNEDLFEEGNLNSIKSTSVLEGWYKKTHWKQKNYN